MAADNFFSLSGTGNRNGAAVSAADRRGSCQLPSAKWQTVAC